MLKKQIRGLLPSAQQVSNIRALAMLGNWVKNPDLWIINRQTMARGVAIGIFCAYLPMPMESLPAALLAVLLNANLPVALMLVWLSNPFTWIILYTPPYLLGAFLLGEGSVSFSEITAQVLFDQISALWLGCIIFGLTLSIAGYFMVLVIWRWRIIHRWQNRHKPSSG